MKYIKSTLSAFISLIVLGGLGLGGYYALKYIIGIFARMEFRIAALTMFATVALLAALIIARSIRRASGQNGANQLHAEKAATYQFFIDLWQDLIRQGDGSEGQGPHKLSEELQILDRRLILYGSPSVIKAHTVLRGLVGANAFRNPDLKIQLAKALIEIRKDLGSRTWGFASGELEKLLTPGDQLRSAAAIEPYNDIPLTIAP